MKVWELFKSCQGEGPGTGCPTTFVRLSGCNLAIMGTPCVWCDTKYAQANSGKSMSVTHVAKRVEELATGCNRVCITGGEPLHQITALRELVDSLKFRDYFVEIFTNGTLVPPLELFHTVDSWVVDIKCPSSGVPHRCRVTPWLGVVRPCDMVKFVVEDERDLNYVESSLMSCRTKGVVSISPCITTDLLDEPSQLVRAWMQTVWDYCVANNYRFGLQVHKVVWGNEKGV